MSRNQAYVEVFAGLSGFLGVVMGALAAHKAQDAYAADLLRQASFYQLAHSVALLTLSHRSGIPTHIARILFMAGIVLFCGGLCLKALTGFSVGPLIPVGGASLMLGWLAVAISPFTKRYEK